MSIYADAYPHKTKAIRIGIISMALVTVVSVLAMVNASSASANTPSNWSGRISGTSITYGWTNDHAWAISDYSDAIAYGAGFVAGQLCAALIREEGPFIGKACSGPVTSIVKSLLQNKPRLTSHGLWAAFYVWPEHETGGTW